ncbi:hypothetical protein SUSAZ_03565 [Sulfolobus acidocaldarius SUSAZ]|nr:hypothetical protein SUSAZ_03565 [Sulfolobus acidocaldarius SUSAZ]
MKTIYIKLSEEEYKQLEERARKEGYVLVSEYIRSILLSNESQRTITRAEASNDLINQLMSRLEKKVIDFINPFTAQLEELKKKIAELSERIEELEDKKIEKQDQISNKPLEARQQQSKKDDKQIQQQSPKKTAIEILNEQGVIFESEVKLRDPDAFFNKLEREGAMIINTQKERIALSREFFEEFQNKVKEIHSSDKEETASKLETREAKLFRKLVEEGLAIYNSEIKGWEILIA